jgi:hypothetical protein
VITRQSMRLPRAVVSLMLVWFPVAETHAVQALSAAAASQPTRGAGANARAPVITSVAKTPRDAMNAKRGVKAARKKTTPPAALPERSAPALNLDVKQAARLAGSTEKAGTHVFLQPGLTANMRQNMSGPVSPPIVEMGDRPARSLGLCGDGKYRRFAELDTRTVTALLPEFNSVRPRTICARRGVLIADYSFK